MHEEAKRYIEVSENKQVATDEVVSFWSSKDPQAAMKWVENQKGIKTAASLKKLIEGSVYKHTDFVIKNLHKLPDEKSREKISKKIYSYFKRSNKTKASEFLESSPYKEYIEERNSKK